MTRETWIIAAALVAFGGCRCGAERRELGLARAPGSGEPVVVVDRPVEGGGGGGGGSVYSGPMTPEAEPNDVRDKAGALALPGGIEGALASPTDVDFYKLEAGAARVVNVRLTGPAADGGGSDLILTLYDGGGKTIAQSDRGPAGTLEALPNFGLAQGAGYFVSVSSFAKKEKKRKPKEAAKPTEAAAGEKPLPPGSYRLTAEVFRPAAADEAEPNDDPAGAREVLLDEEMTGWAGWGKDRDHWKLSLAGFRGGFVLDLGIEGVEGVGLTAELLGEGGKPIFTRKSDKGRGLRVRGLLPEAGAKHWLVRLSGSRSNPEVAYKLKTSARELAEGDESEPNDDPARAITVGPLGDGQEGERRGYLDGGDTDVYRLEGVREPLSLNLSVVPPSGVDVSLRVLSGSKEVVKADTGKVGAREEVDAVRLPAGQALIVVIGGTALGDEPDPYVLRWSSKADLGAPAPAPKAPDEATPSEDPYE